jgi:hypothetical protein
MTGFFWRFVSDSFVNYEGHICVPRDHNSLQAACEKLQVSVTVNCDHEVHKYVLRKNGRFAVYWEQ